MRILWLTWKDIQHPDAGGAEQLSSNFAKQLVKDGHELIVVTSAHGGRGPEELEIDGYRVVRAGNRFSVYWKAFRYVKRELSDWPDVVIEEINTVPFFSRLYLPGKPRLLLFYQLCREIWFYQLRPPLSWLGYVLEPLYLRILRGDPVVTISESSRQDLAKYGFDPAQVAIVTVFTDVAPLDELPPRPASKPWTVVSLGSIRPMKRTLDQVKAFEFARGRGLQARMRIAGGAGGRYGEEVLTAIGSSEYSDDIEYLGRVSEEQKRALLQEADAILVTSVKEGWGLIVTEAAGQGTPAVVYDVDGLRDSVRDRETGRLTATQPAALADGLTALLADTDEYVQARNRAWEWSREFTFERAYATLLARMEAVIDAARVGSVERE